MSTKSLSQVVKSAAIWTEPKVEEVVEKPASRATTKKRNKVKWMPEVRVAPTTTMIQMLQLRLKPSIINHPLRRELGRSQVILSSKKRWTKWMNCKWTRKICRTSTIRRSTSNKRRYLHKELPNLVCWEKWREEDLLLNKPMTLESFWIEFSRWEVVGSSRMSLKTLVMVSFSKNFSIFSMMKKLTAVWKVLKLNQIRTFLTTKKLGTGTKSMLESALITSNNNSTSSKAPCKP